MMNYRLSFNGLSGFDYVGFDTDKEALTWAAHKERLELIKALNLMKYNSQQDRYDIIADLSKTPVEIELPHAGQNKTFCLTYVQNKVYQNILIEAPAVKPAERYFLSKKPDTKILGVREAYPDDMKPDIPVLRLTEKEERAIRDDFLFTDLAELDLSVRTYKCLRKAGIEKIWELVCKTENDLKKIPTLGWKCLGEIHAVLDSYGEILAPSTDPEREQPRKVSLDAQIRSVAYYAESKEVRDAVIESDKLRNMTLDACYAIPGYEQLKREDRNKLYDLVKKAITLDLKPEKGLQAAGIENR